MVELDDYDFESHYFDVDGLKYHYLDEGEGEPVLMVHGNPTWSYYYRNLVKELRGQYRTIVPDHIGCGKSDKPSKDRYDYTLANRVADLTKLVDHLGLDNITLVVHDWGGMIGMTWAVAHIEKIKQIVVLNTGAFHLPKTKALPGSIRLARVPALGDLLMKGFNAFPRGANRYCMTRHKMPDAVAKGYLAPYDTWENRVAVHEFVKDIPLAPGDKAYGIVSDTADQLDILSEKPMLICWGMKDFVFDIHFLREWEKRFPNAEIHRFEDAGHYVLEDAKEDVLPLISKFVTKEARA